MDDNSTHDHDDYHDHESNSPIPIIQNPDNPWLPKTDWSRDGIIASDD